MLTYSPRPALAVDWDCGLLQDCGFDNFYGDSGAGSGAWKIFRSAGTNIGLIQSDGWPKGPSVKVSGDAPFDSGIYQQVKVTPGTGYTFRLAYAVVNINGQGWHDGDQVNRLMGIDPYGGTDVHAGTIKWSSDYYARGKFDDDTLQVSEYAQSSTLTVFIRVINPYNDRHVDVFIDSARLEVNASMPPIAVTAATPTNAPATAKPAQPTLPPATIRPTTLALAATATLSPTVTSVPQATATTEATIEPDATPTRAPTRARRSTPVPTAAAGENPPSVLAIAMFGGISLCGVLFAVILFGVAFWYWRRSNSPPMDY